MWHRLLLVVLLLASCRQQPASPRPLAAACWVWNRNEPLRASEVEDLDAAHIKELFWLAGEMEVVHGQMGWRERYHVPPAPPGLTITPVVRIARDSGPPWDGGLIRHLDELGSSRLQLDFDCPASLLPAYAQALKALKQARPAWQVSITALAGLPAQAAWRDVVCSVDEVFPMFYDLEPEKSLREGARPPPLLDEAVVRHWLPRWQDCPVPWRVGLPNVTRLTRYTSSTVSHRRAWETASLPPDPVLDEAPVLRLWRTPEGFLAQRRPSSESLRRVFKLAAHSSARGVVFFSLPQAQRAASGWSVRHLASLTTTNEAPAPHLTLTASAVEGGERWTLRNGSGFDAADMVLEVRGDAGWLRECLPGGFDQSVPADAAGHPTRAPEASQILANLSRLPAGVSVQTGLVRLALKAARSALRWRIVSGSQKGDWAAIPP